MEANSLELCESDKRDSNFPTIRRQRSALAKRDNLQSAGWQKSFCQQKNTFKSEMCSLCPTLSLYFLFRYPGASVSSLSVVAHTWNYRRIIRFFPSSADPCRQTILSAFFSYFIFVFRCGDDGGGSVGHINKFVEMRFVGGRWHIRSRLCHRQMMMVHGCQGWSVFLFITKRNFMCEIQHC